MHHQATAYRMLSGQGLQVQHHVARERSQRFWVTELTTLDRTVMRMIDSEVVLADHTCWGRSSY